MDLHPQRAAVEFGTCLIRYDILTRDIFDVGTMSPCSMPQNNDVVAEPYTMVWEFRLQQQHHCRREPRTPESLRNAKSHLMVDTQFDFVETRVDSMAPLLETD